MELPDYSDGISNAGSANTLAGPEGLRPIVAIPWQYAQSADFRRSPYYCFYSHEYIRRSNFNSYSQKLAQILKGIIEK
ncbi:Heterokaryon incompatibility protein 6, OR allele [Fusarium oxysporum f. sp. albedinis]|nr:Heterokaryon incompatibility protein 6, OR allele [Fusarium oxysporum f. sp. albedinis]